MTLYNYRVRIVRQDDPEVPDYDSHVPVVFIPYMGSSVDTPVGDLYLPDLSRLREARSHLGWENTERWLSCFWGPTRRLRDTDRDGIYVAVATAEWYDAIGEWQGKPTRREMVDRDLDFEAYLEGEVYYLAPEVREQWVLQARGDKSVGSPLVTFGEPREFDIFDTVETRWVDDEERDLTGGYYGKAHALAMAYDDDNWGYGDTPYLVVDEEGEEVPR